MIESFRVRCITHQKWEYYSLGDLICGSTTTANGEGSFEGKTWGAFIGKMDRNDKQIYEGDIVKYSILKTYCRNDKCDTDMQLGIDKFCPSCGTKTVLSDYITIARVVFEESSFAYRNEKDTEHYISWPCHASEKFIEWVEVIGNIFDNPELIPKVNE